MPPELETVEPQKHTKREKDSVTLFCPVKYIQDSTTPTEILWYKDGRPIDGNSGTNIKVNKINVNSLSLQKFPYCFTGYRIV